MQTPREAMLALLKGEKADYVPEAYTVIKDMPLEQIREEVRLRTFFYFAKISTRFLFCKVVKCFRYLN